MSTAAFAAAEAALLALLTAATPVAAWVKPGKPRPMPKGVAEGVTVAFGRADLVPAEILGGRISVNATITVGLMKRGTPDESAATALDPLMTAVNARITANPTLDGLIDFADLVEVEFDSDHAEDTAHTCEMTWNVMLQVARLTLA